MDICHCEGLNSELTQFCSKRGCHLQNKNVTSSCSGYVETGMNKNHLCSRKVSYFFTYAMLLKPQTMEKEDKNLVVSCSIPTLTISPPLVQPRYQLKGTHFLGNTWGRAGHLRTCYIPSSCIMRKLLVLSNVPWPGKIYIQMPGGREHFWANMRVCVWGMVRVRIERNIIPSR